MPLTRQPKKNLNITELQSYAMALDNAIDVKLEAFEARIEDKLHALFKEFKEPIRTKKNQSEKGDQAQDFAYSRIRVDFPRWKDGDPIGWISRVERYFRFHKTRDASMVDVATIHLEGDVIQWYNWFEHTHGIIWRQFKSGLLIRFGRSKYENVDGQLVKIRQTSTI
ncbi:hypothetical protein BHE74_00041882 [Ensete ventricosum]|nr:hypothetical protein BHE74_00041882 [Ensete ventricosum]